MNRTKHESLVKSTLKRWLPDNPQLDRIADAICNRFEDALEAELEEKDQGIVTDFPDRKFLQPEEAPKLADTLPTPEPAAKGTPGSSMIILAGDEKSTPPAAPLRLPPPGQKYWSDGQTVAPKPQRFWSQDSLRDFAYMNFPEDLQVMAEGRAKPVRLHRNIEMIPGVDLIRVSYALGDCSGPTASDYNNFAGEELPTMAIDTPIFENLSCWQREHDATEVLDRIASVARVAFKPKPKHIDSYTPRKFGPLTYDLRSDPHDETDRIINPVTGKIS